MNILAIDTSTDHLSIAVFTDGKTKARFHRKVGRKHSILLVPTIEKVLKKAGLKIDEIDLYCVGVGPGSFTGLRIGVTVIKGLAYANNKPIVAVPTTDAIAFNAAGHCGIICVILDARKKKVYAALYRSDGKRIKHLSKYMLLPVDELAKELDSYKNSSILFMGDGVHLYREIAHQKFANDMIFEKWHPKAVNVGKLGAELFLEGKITSCEKLEPFYIYTKECDITGF